MTRRRDEINPRQFGAAAAAVDEYLRSLGITDAVFVKTKHVQAKFKIGDRQVSVSIPCTPRDDDAAAKQAVRYARQKITQALSVSVTTPTTNHQRRAFR
jgi:hypothetical protein